MTIHQGNAYLNTRAQEEIQREGANSFAKRAGWGMFSMSLVDFVAGDLCKPLFLLLGAVTLVLLIASLNIAGLQLARASDRERLNARHVPGICLFVEADLFWFSPMRRSKPISAAKARSHPLLT